MALTLDQLGNLGLSSGQKAIIQAAIDIGNSLRGGNKNPDISGLTAVNAKKVAAFYRDLSTLLGPAKTAAEYIREKTMKDAAKAADDAVPGGTL